MKTLFIDCGMGAAGDMLTAALLELLPDPAGFVSELNGLGIPGVEFRAEPSVKCGIRGTHVSVLLDGSEEAEHEGKRHEHTRLREVEEIIEALPVSEKVRGDVRAVYGLIAEAEGAVHGVPVNEIHFHEVGTLDAVADVTAVCMLMDRLAPDEVAASPIHVGSGQVRCAHGVLPVPAPAVAQILKGVPIYGGSIAGELCTPTGAALLKHFAARFGDMPVMRASAVGYGMGRKDFERANCVRAFIGEREDAREEICVLSCNLDDMSAEEIGFAAERLFAGGARDVYTIPIGMKKNRPGTLLQVICLPSEKERLTALMFKHTTTLGVRVAAASRCVLARSTEELDTPYGKLRVKTSSGCGVSRRKSEYDDVARVARELDISLREARLLLEER